MFSNVCETMGLGISIASVLAGLRELLAILTDFRNQQAKMAAFACGLHARLGDRSQVGLLDEQTLMMIAHDAPGRKCLLKEWRELT
jgi:hypothetical protein